jgi:hypothetical protein
VRHRSLFVRMVAGAPIVALVAITSPAVASGAAPKVVEAPRPAGAWAENPGVMLESISCPTTTRCVVGGDFMTPEGNEPGAAWRWAGGKWSATLLPLTSAQSQAAPVNVSGISCPTTTSCTALGNYNATGQPQPAIWSLAGGKWTTKVAPLAVTSGVGMLSCPRRNTCFGDGSAGLEPAVVKLSGGNWTVTPVPLPSNADATPNSGMTGISCATTTRCVAVGGYVSDGADQPVIWTMSGRTWSARQASLPANAAANSTSSIDVVSCPAVNTCIAGGTYVAADGTSQGAFWRLSGTTWSVAQARVPVSAGTNPGPEISAIECPKVTSCVAGGSYYSTGHFSRASMWTLSGQKWSAMASPVPADAASTAIPGDEKNGPYSGITAISCPPSAKPRCVAVGDYVDKRLKHQGFLVEVATSDRSQGVVPVVTTTTQAPAPTTTTLAPPPPTTSTSTPPSSVPTTTPTTSAIAAGSPPCTVAALTAAALAAGGNGVDPQGYGCSGNWAYAGVDLGSGEDASEGTWIFMAVNGLWQRATVQLDCPDNSSSPALPPSILQAACNSN